MSSHRHKNGSVTAEDGHRQDCALSLDSLFRTKQFVLLEERDNDEAGAGQDGRLLRQPQLSGEPVFFCTNRLDWNMFRITEAYAKRGSIDAFYRDAKQNLSPEDYEKRKIGGVRRHIATASIAHPLLGLGSGNAKPGTEVAKAGICLDTLGSRFRIAYTELLTSFIGLVLRREGEGSKEDRGDGAFIASETGNRICQSLEGMRREREAQAQDRHTA